MLTQIRSYRSCNKLAAVSFIPREQLASHTPTEMGGAQGLRVTWVHIKLARDVP